MRFIAGFSLCIVMLGALVRWLPRVLTDRDDHTKDRTERFFELIRILVSCTAAREVLIVVALCFMPTHRDEAFVYRLTYTRLLITAFYAVSFCVCLLIDSSIYLWGSSLVFDRASEWLNPTVDFLMQSAQ